jgi:hypothetical protein
MKLDKTSSAIKFYFRIVASLIVGMSATSGAQASQEPAADESFKETYGTDLQVLGAVDEIDFGGNALRIAGQVVRVGRNTRISCGESTTRTTDAILACIQVGDVLAVRGVADQIATSIQRLQTPYIAGSTLIFVSGTIRSFRPALGVAAFGDLSVDLTRVMDGTGSPLVTPGARFEVVGTQPVVGGVLLAESIHPASASQFQNVAMSTTSASVDDRGPKSIIGTAAMGPKSIIGTATRNPSDTALRVVEP